MKQTLLIITALMLVFGCGSSEKEPEKELINYETTLIERDGVFYTKDTNKPYSGLVLALYNNGEKKSEGTLKDGEPDGVWTYWHENGQKESEGTYKNGKEDGKWTRWYENGQKRVEKNYKDGEEIGSTDWEYYSNGQKRVERNYKDGKEDGKWTYWNEDGREIFPIIPEFVAVKGGTFQMGSNSGRIDEKPVHSVTVSDFNISKTEVTFEQYDAFCDAIGRDKPDDEGWGRGNRPVIYVDWQDAFDYCEWMSKTTGETYRLPTEAEWEYAARGGNKSKGYRYSGSNGIDAVGWYNDNSGGKTHPVAQKQPNELGLYDMSGNVWEWCSDWYSDSYYRSSPKNDPQGPNSGSSRVLRGGSWYYSGYYCRVAVRFRDNPVSRCFDSGFRLVLSQD